MRILNLLAGLVSIAAATQGLAQESLSTTKSYALRPEGKTLPLGVARLRLPYIMATGSEAYDKDGNKSDSVVKYSATGAALVAEYGLNDKISLQWKTDFVLNQKTEMAGNRVWEKAGYTAAVGASSTLQALQTATQTTIDSKASLEKAVTLKTLAGLKTAGACTNVATDCVSFLAGTSDVAAAQRKTISDTVAATETQVYDGVKAKAVSTGGRGMGDTIAGVLYEAYDTNSLFVALAGGIRLPTGNRDLAGTELDTTRSAYEVGLRFNVDALPMDWLMISLQNQSEVGFMGTKRKVSGVTEEYKRDGVRNVGFVYLKPSLEALSPALSAFRASVGVTYDYDSAEIMKKSGVETATQHSQMNWAYASLGYSLLNMQFPLEIDVEHEMPYQGKNVTLATKKTTITAKAYAKF